METKMKDKRWRITINVIIYSIAIVITYMLVPHKEKFEKHFEIGKPWVYELLTAPADIPIYKLEEEVKAEQDSVMAFYVPYLNRNSAGSDVHELINNMRIDGSNQAKIRSYLIQKTDEIYNTGIINLDEYTKLNKYGIHSVSIIDTNNMAHEVPFSDVYTIKSAYDYIMTGAKQTDEVDEKTLKHCNLDPILKENLSIDVIKSKQEEEELIKTVSLTKGMVQKGERIIDRGEVVDKNTYKILRSLEIISEQDHSADKGVSWQMIAGEILIILIMFFLLGCYFYLYRPNVYFSLNKTVFMLLMSVGVLTLVSCVSRYTSLSVYIVPFALLPIVVSVFFDSRTAFFLHLVTTLLASLMVDSSFDFLLIQMAVGMTAVTSLKDMNARGQLVRSAALIFLTYICVFVGIEFMKGTTYVEFPWRMLIVFFINSVMLLFAYGLIYICEKIFGFLSSVTLVELSNVNNAILMEFSEKAPGTFQHVLQVSNLAVEVAKKLNANALLVRTGALYHDIGKMMNPMLFTENQMGAPNPLSQMPYEEAAQVIIAHVTDGVKMAEKASLPTQIIDFIRTHHGTTKTKFFYNSFKNKYPDREIDESLFTYPGPSPMSVETAIVMMADVIEATSRSLPDHKEETIDNMVENLINGLIADGQFKDSPISFKDVETAKMVFKDKLKNIYHSRIKYPELNKKK